MGFKQITLSVLIISALVTKISANDTKPGNCPSQSSGDCEHECASDSACHGVKKFCRHSCGSKCFTPVEKYVPKAGKCHEIQPDEIGLCAIMCVNDESCKGEKKCCRNACGGFGCEQPSATPKPGQCPVVKVSKVANCTSSCQDDHACRGSQKCCRNPCGGNSCVEPPAGGVKGAVPK